jgi:TolB-like protein/tetratricopeptide (TPR) repeat protein/DNA-binding winged helix-turn-helix (wHTH) protein
MDALALQCGFRLDTWVVEPRLGRLSRDDIAQPIGAPELDLLLALATRRGESVGRDELIAALRPHGLAAENLATLIESLQRTLGDDPRDPRHVVAVGQGGYTLVAHVEPIGPDSRPLPTSGGSASLATRIDRLVVELQRRHVFKVAGAYLVAVWIVLQVAETTFEPLHLPPWWMTALTILAVIGLPVVTVLAWSYEITTAGIRLEGPNGHMALPRPRRSLAPWLVAGVAAMAAVTGLAWWRSIDRSDPPLDARVDAPAASVAVLPFVDMSPGVGSSGLLGDGLAEEMSARLAQVPGLRVASRTSAFAYKGVSIDVREIGRALGVRHVLEGSVRRADGRLRVTAQLVDTTQGFHVWSGSFDRDWRDLLAVQGEVAGAVTDALRLMLSPEGRRRVAGRIDVDSAAIEPYLAGLALLRQSGDLSRLHDAQQRFEAALAIDPAFVHPRAGLCEIGSRRYERTRDPDDLAAAEAHCTKALGLDPDLVETRKAFAALQLTAGDWAAAERAYRELTARSPRDADGYIGLGRVLERQHRSAEADHALRRAVEVEPSFWGSHDALGAYLFASGRIDAAVAAYRQAAQLVPGSAAAQNNLGAALQMGGDFTAAGEAYRRSLEIDASASAYSNLGSVHYFLGSYAQAADNYAAATRLADENQQYWGNLGDALWQSPDRREQAVDAYRRAIGLAQRDLAASPRDPVVMAQLAYYHERLREPHLAQPLLDAALAAGGESPYVWYYAAAAMQVRGQVATAQQYVVKAQAAGYPRKLIDADPLLGAARTVRSAQSSDTQRSAPDQVADRSSEGGTP